MQTGPVKGIHVADMQQSPNKEIYIEESYSNDEDTHDIPNTNEPPRL